jgi:hypothetical protein
MPVRNIGARLGTLIAHADALDKPSIHHLSVQLHVHGDFVIGALQSPDGLCAAPGAQAGGAGRHGKTVGKRYCNALANEVVAH